MAENDPLNLAAADDGDGRWVTINGEHVYIENGKITKGPAQLVGKTEAEAGSKSGGEESLLDKLKRETAERYAIEKRVTDFFEAEMERTGVSEAKREQYRAAFKSVRMYMTRGAMNRLAENCDRIQFYNSTAGLTEYAAAIARSQKQPEPEAGMVGGLWETRKSREKGTLHLDGGQDTGDVAVEHAKEIYAHEMTHAIDGKGHELSDTADWREAWHKDIVQGKAVSDYASTSPSEGFAEFGRAMMSPMIRQMKDDCPNCFAYWKSKGL